VAVDLLSARRQPAKLHLPDHAILHSAHRPSSLVRRPTRTSPTDARTKGSIGTPQDHARLVAPGANWTPTTALAKATAKRSSSTAHCAQDPGLCPGLHTGSPSGFTDAVFAEHTDC
jgi:hypothetical protein